MDQQKPYIITIVGPESSGKTTLANELARNFRGPLVAEYAREYLEGLEGSFAQADMERIAEGQLAAQNVVMAASYSQVVNNNVGSFSWPTVRNSLEYGFGNDSSVRISGSSVLSFEFESFGDLARPIIVIDSGMLSLRMWARLKYGNKITLVEESLRHDMTSLYLLCRPVYPWEPDPLREAPALVDRAWIYNHYLSELRFIRSS